MENSKIKKPKVIIGISGGVGFAILTPEDVDVEIWDYDIDNDSSEQFEVDANNNEYIKIELNSPYQDENIIKNSES